MFELRLTEVIPVTQSYVKIVAKKKKKTSGNSKCCLLAYLSFLHRLVMMSLYTKRIKLAYIINYIKTQSKLGVVMHAFKSHRSYEGNFCKCKKVEAGESL